MSVSTSKCTGYGGLRTCASAFFFVSTPMVHGTGTCSAHDPKPHLRAIVLRELPQRPRCDPRGDCQCFDPIHVNAWHDTVACSVPHRQRSCCLPLASQISPTPRRLSRECFGGCLAVCINGLHVSCTRCACTLADAQLCVTPRSPVGTGSRDGHHPWHHVCLSRVPWIAKTVQGCFGEWFTGDANESVDRVSLECRTSVQVHLAAQSRFLTSFFSRTCRAADG